MPLTIDFRDDTPEVVVTLAGDAVGTLFAELAAALRADPRYGSGLSMLVDCSGLVVARLSEDEMRRAVEPVVERDWVHPPRAIAIVAPDPKIRAFVTLANAYMGGSLVNRRVFADAGAAREWLRG